jgi:hypothetical protein
MKKIKLLGLTCFATLVLGLIPAAPLWAFDGDDGGFDGGDDGGEDDDEGGNHKGVQHDKDGNFDGQGHHWVGRHAHDGFGRGLGWAYGPGYYDSFGFGGFGGYGFMPPFYPSPYYTYPPVAVQRVPPPVYIQQQNSAQTAPESHANYWHYCRASEGYYPQVPECPDGWLQVAPQAQNANQE